MAEFAIHLYLITYFEDTLLPNALYGFISSGTLVINSFRTWYLFVILSLGVNILLAQWLGSLVDRVHKLTLIRRCIVFQKLSACLAYAVFAFLFTRQSRMLANDEGRPQSPSLFQDDLLTPMALATILVCGAVLQASNTCLTLIVERDWVTCITKGSSEDLSKINARLRRIDLLCKLCAPLSVSLISTVVSYLNGSIIMSTMTTLSMAIELGWINIVWRSIPALQTEQDRKDSVITGESEPGAATEEAGLCLHLRAPRTAKHWAAFVRLPTFLSSLSASFLYMTVLS